MIPVEVVHRWMRGNVAAVDFLSQLYDAFHLWDDLIDGDKAVTPAQINQAFYAAFISIPRNPFYLQHFALLSPVMETAILNWHVANDCEREDTDRYLHLSYVLRSSHADVLGMCARIVGGVEWARQVLLEFRQKWTPETFAEYTADLRARENV